MGRSTEPLTTDADADVTVTDVLDTADTACKTPVKYSSNVITPVYNSLHIKGKAKDTDVPRPENWAGDIRPTSSAYSGFQRHKAVTAQPAVVVYSK